MSDAVPEKKETQALEDRIRELEAEVQSLQTRLQDASPAPANELEEVQAEEQAIPEPSEVQVPEVMEQAPAAALDQDGIEALLREMQGDSGGKDDLSAAGVAVDEEFESGSGTLESADSSNEGPAEDRSWMRKADPELLIDLMFLPVSRDHEAVYGLAPAELSEEQEAFLERSYLSPVKVEIKPTWEIAPQLYALLSEAASAPATPAESVELEFEFDLVAARSRRLSESEDANGLESEEAVA